MTDPHRTEPDHTQPADTGDHTPRGRLSASDVQALRRADAVSFHHHDGAGSLRASLTTWPLTEPRIYTATEQRLFPHADGVDRHRRIDVEATVCGYDEQRRWHERGLPGAAAVAAIQAARLDDVWCSIADFLRVGDVVALHWRADNNNRDVDQAGLHTDELRIGIRHGRRSLMFLLLVQVGADAARMLTRPTRT